MRFDDKFLEENRAVFDSSAVLDVYNSEFKELSKKLKIVEDKVSLFKAVMRKYVDEIGNKENKDIGEASAVFKKYIEDYFNRKAKLEIEAEETEDESRKFEIYAELMNRKIEYFNKESDFYVKAQTYKQTGEILKPIFDTNLFLEESRKKIRNKIYVLKLKKNALYSAFILFYALMITLFLDKMQTDIETEYHLKHSLLVSSLFAFQFFIVDPYILNPLRNTLNWEIIKDLRTNLPQFKATLTENVDKYNGTVGVIEAWGYLKVKFD